MAVLDEVGASKIERLTYAPYHARFYTFLSKFRIARFIPFFPDKNDMEREHKDRPIFSNHS